MVTKRVRIVFSIISTFLMIPMIYAFNKQASDFNNFYRTLFVFYIDEVVEMFADEDPSINTLFAIWDIINQWSGALVCAVSFCMLMSDFQILLNGAALQIQVIMLGIVFSGLICTICKDIVNSYRRKVDKEKIKRQVKE